jgi:hypothetical protein
MSSDEISAVRSSCKMHNLCLKNITIAFKHIRFMLFTAFSKSDLRSVKLYAKGLGQYGYVTYFMFVQVYLV